MIFARSLALVVLAFMLAGCAVTSVTKTTKGDDGTAVTTTTKSIGFVVMPNLYRGTFEAAPYYPNVYYLPGVAPMYLYFGLPVYIRDGCGHCYWHGNRWNSVPHGWYPPSPPSRHH